MKIALSAGHTPPSDPGAAYGSYTEAEYVQKIKECIMKKIDGIIPYVDIARVYDTNQRHHQAKRAGCDYYLSLHINSVASPSATGIEAYYNGQSGYGKAYEWANDLVFNMVTHMGFPNRKARHESTSARMVDAIRQYDDIPAVLLENGFISNYNDRKKIVEQYEFMADSIIYTLCKYAGVPLYVLKINHNWVHNDKTGKDVQIDVPPQLVNGNTMLPIRAIAEALGAKVDWNANTKQIIITYAGNQIVLQLDNIYAKVNSKTIKMRIAPQEINGRTLVPVRDVTNLLGHEVLWHPNTKQVSIIMTKGK
jgi:hypothetical protein